MKVGIIGSGGREHALCLSIKKSPKVNKIYCFPGNAGTSDIAENIEIDLSDFNKIKEFSIKNEISLLIVGPEKPLVDGIVDFFSDTEINIFGPDKISSQLEGSKIFTKKICEKYKIPTAKFGIFENSDDAISFLDKTQFPLVVKADGLASGKGVYICENKDDANLAIKEVFDGKFGLAKNILLEEFLVGEEMSYFIISDGKEIQSFETAQDHKRVLEGDKGANTGGMGAYSPAPIVTDEVNKKIMDQVIIPTIEGMKKEGIEFSGFLYAGIIVDPNKNIKTLEFNCRMGDPETQPLLFRMQSDLFSVLFKAAKQELEGVEINWDKQHAITIVMASKDYPIKPILGDEINLPNIQDDSTFIFHAGTNIENSKIMTSGGRVLGVTAKGRTLEIAKNKAYDVLKKIDFNGAQFRTDIGKKALN